MKTTILRYGLYATLLILLLSALHFFVLAKTTDYSTQEIFGYLSMFLSMIFVFMGIRHYRDRINGGHLTFAEGLKVGVLIVLIPAFFFGLFDVLYTSVINPSWSDQYYAHYISEIKKTTPSAQQGQAIKEAEAQKAMFANPLFLFFIMFFTVFVIGFIVTIISALALRKKEAVAL